MTLKLLVMCCCGRGAPRRGQDATGISTATGTFTPWLPVQLHHNDLNLRDGRPSMLLIATEFSLTFPPTNRH